MMKTNRFRLCIALTAALVLAPGLEAQDAPHHRQAREIFERLISFRSAAGHKQVPPMVRYMTDTLRAGGVPEANIITLPHEETMALLVRVPGTDAAAHPILFSAHMDVVDARLSKGEGAGAGPRTSVM
jgi:acetylornithine deacetylase/succinyl-diaminopimelate desuccinylase-like protein